MIRLEMIAHDGQMKVHFDVPNQPEDKIRLDDLAAFSLHLDVIKHRLTEITSHAISRGEGYDLNVTEELKPKVHKSA